MLLLVAQTVHHWGVVHPLTSPHTLPQPRKFHEPTHTHHKFQIPHTPSIQKRILGMIAEQFVPDGLCVKLYNYKENHWDHLMNWQHVTMCLFYSISGCFGRSFLFYYYKHGRATLDLHVHQLLLGAIFGVSICIFLEVFFHGSIVTIRLRTSLCILQGSWLWQIVFVLYPPNGIPEGNQMDHNNMLFLTMCCCWHYAFAFLILAVNYTVVNCLCHSQLLGLCKISPGASFQICFEMF
uniref:Transmembrane protein 45B n=1 Tax=Crocodylus porosus TaxID=8502 RepID=A0A7M4E3H2_CROPO